MEKVLLEEERKLIEGAGKPTVSIILPFGTKLGLKEDLQHKLKVSLQKIERELLKKHSPGMVENVIAKLQHILDNLNFDTHKKSIAIFVSPFTEKIFYLDVEVEEKIAINASFEIRDLINNKKENKEYLVLLLGGKLSKMYLADHSDMRLVKSTHADNIHAYIRDLPERVPHFDDPHAQHEIEVEKFLHHIDENLSQIVKAYPFPVFVAGVERLLGHFKKITKNENCIASYVHGNYEECSEHELKEILRPFLDDWDKLRQADLLNQMDRAAGEHRLVSGVRDVLAAAIHKNCRLLIVEKDYISTREEGDAVNSSFYINDMVGHIIEEVLESGGNVELVDNDFLKEYQHIVLLKYY